jgi:CheY-like chemotaxis protein
MSALFVNDPVERPEVDRPLDPATADLPDRRRLGLLPDFCSLSKTAFPADGLCVCRGCILLVDDSDSVRETLADLLETEGFCVFQAANAAEAVMVMCRTPVVDVLVTDLSMPGADGITLINQAREIQHAIPAILLTGYAEQVTSIAVTAGGNFNVLRKPVEGDRLVEQIATLIKRPRPA